MHLDSLTIKNFRILEDVEVKKLGHINLIVGKNNSGKSTVLEALALLASGFNPKVVNQLTSNRNINRHKPSNRTNDEGMYISSLFYNQANICRDVISIGNNDFYLRIGASNTAERGDYYDCTYNVEPDLEDFKVLDNDFVLDENDFKYQNILLSSSRQLHPKFSRSLFDMEMKKNRLASQLIDTNPIDIEQLALYWDDIALTDNERLLVQALKLIEPKIGNIAFLSDENSGHRAPFVRLDGVENRVALHQMGDGIFRILQIILQVLKAKDGFLLIDEFENGLHYSVQPEVWRLIFELADRFNIQVFATTHSWDCIESFAQVAKERTDLEGVLFRMGRSARKSDKGKVIATEFNEDELYNLTKDNIEVR